MDINKIKNIDIVKFLAGVGCMPVRQQGCNSWFLSPLREERTPSFHVNTDKNRWHDFGSAARGGDIINLVEQLYQIGFREAIDRLTLSHSWSSLPHHEHEPRSEKPVPTSPFTEVKAEPLANKQLIDYIASRGVDLTVAQDECLQVSFRLYGKRKLAIGFRNDAGGYELRNAREKICMSKDVSTRRTAFAHQRICVFEGFFDYLSLLTMMKPQHRSSFDYLVLNSTSMVQKAIPFLQGYAEVHCYLDNDNAGREATSALASKLSKVIDHASRYADYNDVNDFLCNNKLLK